MSIAAIENDSSWDVLLRAWEELGVPDGWRAEIIGEGITLVPPPKGGHNEIVACIQDQLHEVKARGGVGLPRCGIYNNTDVRIPLLGQLYIPDLVILPRPLTKRGEEHSAEDALIVVEVTSKRNADTDRKAKRWGYAHGPVPLYLLADRWDEEGPTVTLFSEPEGGTYRTIKRVPFGEAVTVPEPFGFELDTSEFPTDE
ncbi:Uma2 family endonuclease [Spinactinospora alkalitolerans]|uniref:Uma2 family endonuclease n=1 Tax=Spinactinospora alkalitolerans TaxID=687207 RepID=A0A852U1S5_9ACTN|nr:Uma2 family endonuclease [Spinactinospora alkalitolerans]NYE48923.1 Uma2 family endonuclease [Spinactinospora alkalitolerans]